MSSSTSHRPQARRSALTFLLLTLIFCVAQLPTADAVITALTLRNSRFGNAYSYTMYNGSVITGESFVTGTTTYPYVFDHSMNTFVVQLLNQYLAFHNKTLHDVGGTLAMCMGSGGADATGEKCYKALLAASAPADCPTPNVLCCPLFWRVGGQDIETTMTQMNLATIFWNGAYAVNGFYANFSESYLMQNSNCSKPLFNGTTEISLAVDVTGEWRFVPLRTAYVLQETALNVNAAEAAELFGGVNPQDTINGARLAQRPVYHVLNSYYIPVIVCVVLLLFVGLFLVLACSCGTRRTATKVRRAQLRLLELKSVSVPSDSLAILNAISPESSSGSSSSERSRRSKQSMISRKKSDHSAKVGELSNSGSFSSGDGASDHESKKEEHNGSEAPSRKPSVRSKGSSKSLKSNSFAASRKASSDKKPQRVSFAPPPGPLPGIRPRTSTQQQQGDDGAPSRAAPVPMAKRPSSTGTVVHHLSSVPQSSSVPQKGWFDAQRT
jgi:hypothetical protein